LAALKEIEQKVMEEKYSGDVAERMWELLCGIGIDVAEDVTDIIEQYFKNTRQTQLSMTICV
jgi:hypothetical protein